MDVAFVIMQVKQKIEADGQVNLTSMGLLPQQSAQIIEGLKSQDNFVITYSGKDVIVKKSLVKEEKSNLELQKLRSENIKLVNELTDYDKIKRQRNVLFWVSILTVILLIVKFLQKKP